MCSGHASDAARPYKRLSIESEQRVSDAFQPPRPKPTPAAACSTDAAQTPTAQPTTKTDNNAVSIILVIPSVV